MAVRTTLGDLTLDEIGKKVFGGAWGGGGTTTQPFFDVKATFNAGNDLVGAPDQAMVQPTSRTVLQSASRIAAGMTNPLRIASMTAPKAAPSLFTSFDRANALAGGGGAEAPAPTFADALGTRSATTGGGGVPAVAWVAGGLVLAAAAVAIVVKRKRRP